MIELKTSVTAADTQAVQVAAQHALLKTAEVIQAAEVAEMGRVFDRPTRWTLGAMKVKPTARFEIAVGILDPDGYYKRAQGYLGTQVIGGSRRVKAFEMALTRRGILPQGWMAVPGAGAEMDAYGNMSPGQIRQVLAWFDAAERFAGSTQNMGEKGRSKRRKGTRSKRGFEYFAVIPGRSNGGRHVLRAGIYKRTSFVFGKAIQPVLIFVRKAVYSARYDFDRVAIETFEHEYPGWFGEYLAQAREGRA